MAALSCQFHSTTYYLKSHKVKSRTKHSISCSMQPTQSNIKVVINGAAKEIGRAAVLAVTKARGMEVAGAVDTYHVGEDIGKVCGMEEPLEIPILNDLTMVLGSISQSKETAIVVDFTDPSSVYDNVKQATAFGMKSVVHVPRMKLDTVAALSAFCEKASMGVLIAPTLSIGSILLQQAAISASFHYRNVEIVESKANADDLPSADANQIANNLSNLGQIYNREDSSTDVLARGQVLGDGIRVHSLVLPGLPSGTTVHFSGPGEIYSIKHDITDVQWNAFKDKCAWNAKEYDDTLMENIFHKKASQRLRDLLAKTKRTNTRPVWMGEGIWDDLKKHWEKPEVQKISEINKKNRASDTGGSLHTGGSISTAEHKARMEFDLGKRVGLPDIHRALHFKKNGEPVDERARRLQEEYEKNLSQRRSQVGDPDTSSTGTQFEMEHDSWIDVTGGINKKGRIPGAGNLARAYKEFPSSSSRSSSTGRSYVKEQAIVNDLVRQLAEEKEKRTQMEERMNQKMDEMRRWMFEMLQGHGASTLLTPRPTPRPTSMPYLPRGQPSSDVPYPTGSQFHCSPPPDGWHYTTPPGSQYWYGPRPGEFPHFGPPRAPRHDPANSPMSFVDAQPHQAPYIPRLHEENPRPRSDVTASIGFMELLRRGDRQLHEEYLQDGQHYDH